MTRKQRDRLSKIFIIIAITGMVLSSFASLITFLL